MDRGGGSSKPDLTDEERERARAEQERALAAEEEASGLTSDLMDVYGLGNFRTKPVAVVGAAPRVSTPKPKKRVPGTNVVGPAGNWVGTVDSGGRIRRDGDAGGRR